MRLTLIFCAVAATFYLWMASFAPYLKLDRWLIGMWFTYPPGMMLMALAFVCSLIFISLRKTVLSILALLSMLPLIMSAIVFTVEQPALEQPLNLLAFNFHDSIEHVDELAEICRDRKIDIMVLQEVSPDHRLALYDKLHQYTFFTADESADKICRLRII